MWSKALVDTDMRFSLLPGAHLQFVSPQPEWTGFLGLNRVLQGENSDEPENIYPQTCETLVQCFFFFFNYKCIERHQKVDSGVWMGCADQCCRGAAHSWTDGSKKNRQLQWPLHSYRFYLLHEWMFRHMEATEKCSTCCSTSQTFYTHSYTTVTDGSNKGIKFGIKQ